MVFSGSKKEGLLNLGSRLYCTMKAPLLSLELLCLYDSYQCCQD